MDTTTTRSASKVGAVLYGMHVAGWITSTQTDTDGQVLYGFFATIEQAQDWAKNLVNATIEPVYHPAFNAG